MLAHLHVDWLSFVFEPLQNPCHEDLAFFGTSIHHTTQVPQLQSIHGSLVVDAFSLISLTIEITVEEGTVGSRLPQILPALGVSARAHLELVGSLGPFHMDFLDIREAHVQKVPLVASEVPPMHIGRSEVKECELCCQVSKLVPSSIRVEHRDWA